MRFESCCCGSLKGARTLQNGLLSRDSRAMPNDRAIVVDHSVLEITPALNASLVEQVLTIEGLNPHLLRPMQKHLSTEPSLSMTEKTLRSGSD